MEKSGKNYLSVSLLIVGLIAGILAVETYEKMHLSTSAPTTQVRVDMPQYKYINPLLYSDTPRDDAAPYNSLMKVFESDVSSSTRNGVVTNMSVYYRDLDTGHWTGVNENELYRPSSMLKVVVLMAVLQVAEQDPSFLTKQVYYASTDHSDQYYKPAQLPSGYYTIQRLVNAMIIDSDNDALSTLQSDPHVGSEFNDMYALFRLPQVSTSSPDFMSPKSYSVLFRSLYNSTLFPWSLSEQILDLLTHTTFTAGLVAGVPAGTTVAHKFGENTGTAPDGTIVERELHDCGIIYYPHHPYFLCVMTQGADFGALGNAIAAISRDTYTFTENQYPI